MSNAGSTNKKLFLNQLIALGFNIVKSNDYGKLKLEKEGYNKSFGQG